MTDKHTGDEGAECNASSVTSARCERGTVGCLVEHRPGERADAIPADAVETALIAGGWPRSEWGRERMARSLNAAFEFRAAQPEAGSEAGTAAARAYFDQQVFTEDQDKAWAEWPDDGKAQFEREALAVVAAYLSLASPEAGSEEAERVTLAEALRWLRNEDPSALKGYWPALHALEDHFGVVPAPALSAAHPEANRTPEVER